MELRVVSLETAKKLKEVGFDENTLNYYHPNYGLDSDFSAYRDDDFSNKNIGNWAEGYYSAPTLALVQMWLREKHNINISIILRTGTGMYRSRIDYKINNQWKNDIAGIFNVHDQALEAGILEAIKLIKQ